MPCLSYGTELVDLRDLSATLGRRRRPLCFRAVWGTSGLCEAEPRSALRSRMTSTPPPCKILNLLKVQRKLISTHPFVIVLYVLLASPSLP